MYGRNGMWRGVVLAAMMAGMGLAVAAPLALPSVAQAQQFPAFRLALAEGVSSSPALSAFYRSQNYAPVWTGPDQAARRQALVSALARAGEHGLPGARYDLDGLMAAFRAVQSERDRGFVEALASRTFVQYATDISSGVINPGAVVEQIVRTLPRPDAGALMADFVAAEPVSFIRNLAPAAPEYSRLMRAKHQLEEQIAQGGWGPTVPAGGLRPGDQGEAVIALRNRLILPLVSRGRCSSPGFS